MINVEPTIFNRTIEEARLKAAGKRAILNAIDRFVEQFEQHPELFHYEPETHTLICASATTVKAYSANGSCQCGAFQYSRVCWHRVGSRIFQRYFEAQAIGGAAAPAETTGEKQVNNSLSPVVQGIYRDPRNGRAIRDYSVDGWTI